MKIKEQITVRKVGNDYLILSDSLKGVDYSDVVSLNETAGLLLEHSQGKSFEASDWVTLLLEHYEVDEEQAKQDVTTLIEQLKSYKLIIE